MALVKTLTVVLPILALPAVVGEVTYLALQAVDLPIGNAELFRAVGAVAAAWWAFFNALAWRTFTMTRANHQTLHGVKENPGGMVRDMVALRVEITTLREDVRRVPAEAERRFDGAVDRMVGLADGLETRIARLEDRHMGEEHR